MSAEDIQRRCGAGPPAGHWRPTAARCRRRGSQLLCPHACPGCPRRTRLLENEIRVLRDESNRLNHEKGGLAERVKVQRSSVTWVVGCGWGGRRRQRGRLTLRPRCLLATPQENHEKIKLNNQLPYLVANIVEVLGVDPEEEEEEDGALRPVGGGLFLGLWVGAVVVGLSRGGFAVGSAVVCTAVPGQSVAGGGAGPQRHGSGAAGGGLAAGGRAGAAPRVTCRPRPRMLPSSCLQARAHTRTRASRASAWCSRRPRGRLCSCLWRGWWTQRCMRGLGGCLAAGWQCTQPGCSMRRGSRSTQSAAVSALARPRRRPGCADAEAG